jgi:hypothetical protein
VSNRYSQTCRGAGAGKRRFALIIRNLEMQE